MSGSLADAQRAGFDNCFNMDAVHLRCRRHNVMLEDQGPYEAAVDLVGSDGEGGFDQVILWHDRDNNAMYKVTDTLKDRGWVYCFTGVDARGDQIILTKAGAPVRISVDLSYWSKRRLRIIPLWNERDQRCAPKYGAGLTTPAPAASPTPQ